MKFHAAAATALFCIVPTLASAATVLVDFEKQWDYLNGDIDGYYGGGTAADGTSGANLGISFTNVSGLSNDPSFDPYYTNAPSMIGTAYAHTYAPTDKAFMDVASGATGALSFYYSSASALVGAVSAWSGFGGTGTLLGTLNLAANESAGYAVWTPVSLTFSGVARSFDFTGSANVAGLDNLSVTAAVPEPSIVGLLLAGGAATLLAARRKRHGAR